MTITFNEKVKIKDGFDDLDDHKIHVEHFPYDSECECYPGFKGRKLAEFVDDHHNLLGFEVGGFDGHSFRLAVHFDDPSLVSHNKNKPDKLKISFYMADLFESITDRPLN